MRRKINLPSDDSNNTDHTPFIPPRGMLSSNNNRYPSSLDLLELKPNKTGVLLKKNNSWLAYFFPYCYKQWNSRFCILIGNYLFKYESEDSDKPKGVPIPVDSVTVSFTEPPECHIIVKTIRKTYIFKGADKGDCVDWVNAIRNRKYDSIKEQLGHLPVDPKVLGLNKIGLNMFDDKLNRERNELRGINSTVNPMFG